MCERYLHRSREQSFAIRAYAMSAVGIDLVSVHKLFAYRVVSTVSTDILRSHTIVVVVVVVLLFYVQGKHLRSCQNGQLT